MKDGIHPDYREVVFLDIGSKEQFITRSTIKTKETINLDGKTYPLVKVEISSSSHPFYTGKMKRVDAAGRVDKFEKKWGKRKGKADDNE